jgi:hypothetical protein
MNQIAELTAVVRDQMAEIDRLRADNERLRAEVAGLVAWAAGDCDALATLQAIYSNPKTYQGDRLKAAASALPYERSKPAAVVIQYSDFNERLRTIRLAQLAKDKARWAAEDAAKTIEHQPLDLDAPTSPTILGGDDSAA